MFAGYEEDLLLHAFEQPVERVKFFRRREVRQIAGVENEIGRLRQRLDAGDGLLQCGRDVSVDAFLAEADVRITDLRYPRTQGQSVSGERPLRFLDFPARGFFNQRRSGGRGFMSVLISDLRFQFSDPPSQRRDGLFHLVGSVARRDVFGTVPIE